MIFLLHKIIKVSNLLIIPNITIHYKTSQLRYLFNQINQKSKTYHELLLKLVFSIFGKQANVKDRENRYVKHTKRHIGHCILQPEATAAFFSRILSIIRSAKVR
jgi:hypothetical protein